MPLSVHVSAILNCNPTGPLDLKRFEPPFPLECSKRIRKHAFFWNTFWWASAIRCQLFSPDQKDLYHQFLLPSLVHPHHQDDIPCTAWHYIQVLQKTEYKNRWVTFPQPLRLLSQLQNQWKGFCVLHSVMSSNKHLQNKQHNFPKLETEVTWSNNAQDVSY